MAKLKEVGKAHYKRLQEEERQRQREEEERRARKAAREAANPPKKPARTQEHLSARSTSHEPSKSRHRYRSEHPEDPFDDSEEEATFRAKPTGPTPFQSTWRESDMKTKVATVLNITSEPRSEPGNALGVLANSAGFRDRPVGAPSTSFNNHPDNALTHLSQAPEPPAASVVSNSPETDSD